MLYEVFDAVTGDTLAIVDREEVAMALSRLPGYDYIAIPLDSDLCWPWDAPSRTDS